MSKRFYKSICKECKKKINGTDYTLRKKDSVYEFHLCGKCFDKGWDIVSSNETSDTYIPPNKGK